MAQFEVLVGKLISVDAEGTTSISVEEVSTLGYETVNDAVEDGAFVAHGLVVDSMFSRTQLAKVFSGPVEI